MTTDTAAAVLRTSRKHRKGRKPTLRRRILASSIAGLLGAFSFAPRAAAQNLVTNGGFESGDFTGWTLTGDTSFTDVNAGGAQSGTYYAVFGSVTSQAFLSQNLATISGASYTVSYWLNAFGDNPSTFSASFNGNVLSSLTNPSTGGYQQFTFTASATSASTPLSFATYDRPNFLFLDTVSVTLATVNATHWTGGLATDGLWTTVGNWAGNQPGTLAATQVPTAADDITFSADNVSGPRSTTLGADFTIHSLTINDKTAVSIGGANLLTIAGDATTGISVADGANLTISSSLSFGNSSDTITVNGAGVAAISGNFSSGNLITKQGTGTLTLSGDNSGLTGGFTLSNGTLNINSATALGTGNFVIDGSSNKVTIDSTNGAVALTTNNTQDWYTGFTFTGSNNLDLGTGQVTLHGDSNSIVTVTVSAGNLTVRGVIQDSIDGGEGLTKAGAGTLTLLGANTYSGGTTVAAGTLYLGDGSAAASLTGDVTVDGGAIFKLNLANGTVFSNNITDNGHVIADDLATSNYTMSGIISGSGDFTKTGSNTVTLSGVNTYSGATYVSGGTLMAGVSNTGGIGATTNGAFGNNSAVSVTGTGILQLNGFNAGIGSLTGDSSGIVQNASTTAATLTTGGNGNNTTFPGIIQDGLVGVIQIDFVPPPANQSLTPGASLSIYKVGTGTQTLSGLNTYTGTTTVTAGTLMAGVSNAGGPGTTGPGAFGNNSAVLLSSPGILQLNSYNVGIGSLADAPIVVPTLQTPTPTINQINTTAIVQNSSATPATLTTGGNNYSTYFSGIIQDGLIGFVEPGSRTPAPNQSIPGAALSLWKVGTGTQTLAGLNTYTGTTTVTGGTLMAGVSNAGGIGATGPGAFGNNSAVTVSGAGILQLNGYNAGIGSLAGDSGGIVQDGSATPATLTTGGNSTNTTFAGTIQDGIIKNPTAGDIATIPAPLSIYKTGSGTQTLTGASTYTGGTTLVAGTLAAGNTKAFGSGNLTLLGGTLRTTGGPLAVDIGAGNILFGGGTYLANVGGTQAGVQSDQLKTTGSANISGGTLSLVQLNNYRLMPGDKVVLLSATGGVTGGSANGTAVPASHVTGLSAFSNTPLLVPMVNIYTTSVVLEAMQGSFIISGLTPNQTAVATALNSLSAQTGGHTGIFKELDFLDTLPTGSLAANLDMISPEELTSIFHLMKSLANIQTSNIQQRLADIRSTDAADIAAVGGLSGNGGGANGPTGSRGKAIAPAEDARWGMWFTGSGEFTHVGNTANAAGFSLDSGGLTAGVDYRFSSKFAAGISLGYMNTTASLANGGKIDVDGGRIGTYATYFEGGLHIDASVTGGLNGYSTRRTTPNNTAATASPQGSEVNMLLAAGYDWKFKGLTLGPTASFQYTNMQLNGFTESGAFAPLNVYTKNADSARSALGFHATFDTKVHGVTIRPEARAAWQHEFGDTSYSLTSSFSTLGGSAFTVAGPETGRDSLLVGAGFTILWNDRFSTYAFYDGELLRSNYSSNNVSVGFRWKF
jgi:outer membrane autotransporter protein